MKTNDFISMISRKNATPSDIRRWISYLEGALESGLLTNANVEQCSMDVGEYRTVVTISVLH